MEEPIFFFFFFARKRERHFAFPFKYIGLKHAVDFRNENVQHALFIKNFRTKQLKKLFRGIRFSSGTNSIKPKT